MEPKRITQNFVSVVRARSIENNDAFELLYKSKFYTVCIGLLRLELDTLLRLCFLWRPETASEVGC